MADRDGNGWIRCAQGHRHWGRFGAAGLLAYVPGTGAPAAGGVPGADVPGAGGVPGAGVSAAGGDAVVLLQRRSEWVNHPGTWGPPGGAMDSHESAVSAALREAAEECGVPAGAVTVGGIMLDDHGGWSYQTVIAAAAAPFPVRNASDETSEVGWISEGDVGQLDLHPGFAAQWPSLRAWLAPLTVIVDVANVMGSRADGWWRDRAAAAIRLHGELTALAAGGIPELPAAGGAFVLPAAGGVSVLPAAGRAFALPGSALERWFPGFVLVLEGAARAALRNLPAQSDGLAKDRPPEASRVQVVAASGSGDDLIADLAARLPGYRLVVTADRELRGRCVAAGAAVTGPRWLLGML